MGFSCGIVGLPNVGKSTLFNALTETAAAQAENYPFCTIEPNLGEVAVPDPRLEPVAALAKSTASVPTRLAFVDIAGLVRGASRGEGLGNQFLANIREVDAVVHVVRCFSGSDVIHLEGRIAPVEDIETIETELMLADLDSLERRIEPLEKRSRGGDPESGATLDLVTFFTAGPKEAHAWTVTRGTRAPQAAGVIHTDFERGFIRAEVVTWEDYVALGGEAGARDAGKLRLEGKDYAVADGDVIHFRFAT